MAATLIVAAVGAASVATLALTHQRPAAQGAGGVASTAAVPTACPAGTGPTVAAGLSGSQLDQAIQAYDAWDKQCEAAWWANVDISTVDWASIPHKPLASVGDGPGPEFATLTDAVRGADTIVVGTVTSIGKGDGSVVFNLAVADVLKGTVSSTQVAMIDEGRLAPLSGPPPSGLAIQDLPGVAFPIPGQQVIVLGSLTSTGLQPQLYSGIYVVDNNGTVSAAPGNTFGSAVSGTTESGLIGAIQSALAG